MLLISKDAEIKVLETKSEANIDTLLVVFDLSNLQYT